jgi:hypothetical protein
MNTTVDKIQVIAKIRADFEAVRDRVIQVTELTAYVDEDSIDFHLSTPALVKVVQTPLSDLTHEVYPWMDPYWNLELVEPHPELKDARSLWMFGTSYDLESGLSDPARYEKIKR